MNDHLNKLNWFNEFKGIVDGIAVHLKFSNLSYERRWMKDIYKKVNEKLKLSDELIDIFMNWEGDLVNIDGLPETKLGMKSSSSEENL
jgi:energy-converting hydrogenase A subunit M